MISLLLIPLLTLGGGIGHVKKPHVELSWTETDTNVVFRIYRGFTPGTEGLYASNVSMKSYTDSSVSRGETYYYYVTAVRVSDGAESDPSNEVAAVIPHQHN